jgi:signal transduction histidine kinase
LRVIPPRNPEIKIGPRRKSFLLRGVMHEIRRPLSVIRAYSSFGIGQTVELSGGEVLDLLQEIDSAANMLDLILGDLETVALKEGTQVRVETLDLMCFFAETASRFQALAPGRKLSVTLHDPRCVRADRLRLEQVISNLVENANNYSLPGGEICIESRREANQIVLTVSDEGPGAPERDLERIFEPFFRGPGVASDVRGSGLGLAICRDFVAAQEGSMWASLPDSGGFQIGIALPAAA